MYLIHVVYCAKGFCPSHKFLQRVTMQLPHIVKHDRSCHLRHR